MKNMKFENILDVFAVAEQDSSSENLIYAEYVLES